MPRSSVWFAFFCITLLHFWSNNAGPSSLFSPSRADTYGYLTNVATPKSRILAINSDLFWKNGGQSLLYFCSTFKISSLACLLSLLFHVVCHEYVSCFSPLFSSLCRPGEQARPSVLGQEPFCISRTEAGAWITVWGHSTREWPKARGQSRMFSAGRNSQKPVNYS